MGPIHTAGAPIRSSTAKPTALVRTDVHEASTITIVKRPSGGDEARCRNPAVSERQNGSSSTGTADSVKRVTRITMPAMKKLHIAAPTIGFGPVQTYTPAATKGNANRRT